MSFTSFEFILFFLTLLLLRVCVRSGGGERWLLLAASVCFYLSWSAPCICLVLFTSVVDYSLGMRISQTANPASRRRLLVLSVVTNVGLLAFFKYTNFFLENICFVINALGGHVGELRYNIILPPAISYFTFASLSYVIDVYYERLSPCSSLRDYALFVTFFPKLLSGPIVRAREFLPQLQQRSQITAEDVEIGLVYFLQGAVKKLVIADQVAGNVNLVFADPARYDGFTLLQALLGYTVQIYCDFSGYSDMAIGCARILGFRFSENFQMPFSSVTITEFWRRWHVTLSQWFRDYVFLPMELAMRDNPRPVVRGSINMMCTMLLCGLWHGASWNFIIWGGIHGAALALHKAWTNWKPLRRLENHAAWRILWNLFSRVLTLGVVLLGMVFFRAQSFADAQCFLSRMLLWRRDGLLLLSPYIIPGVAAVFLAHLLIDKEWNAAQELPRRSVKARVLAYSFLLAALVFLGASQAVPFIYFQF